MITESIYLISGSTEFVNGGCQQDYVHDIMMFNVTTNLCVAMLSRVSHRNFWIFSVDMDTCGYSH